MAAPKESLEERLDELQEEYSKTKDNKATNKAVGLLRHKMAEIKKQMAAGGKGHGQGFFVKKSGDATVALMGFPSVGKSSLINALTNVKSKTAPYAFTTTTVIQGTMVQNDSHIQIFDMPGIIEGAHLGVGGGRAVIGAMRVSDLVAFVVDFNDPAAQLDMLLKELRALKIRINERRPAVQIIDTGTSKSPEIELNRSGIPDAYVAEIFSGLGRYGARVKLEEKIGMDDLISLVTGRSYYMKALVVLNKTDLSSDYAKIAAELSKSHNIEVIPVSATQGTNITKLRERIYDSLGIMTVYLTKVDAENKMPVVLRRGSKVIDAASKLHTSLADELSCAYVTGPSSRFARQRVGAKHVLMHGDTITFIKVK